MAGFKGFGYTSPEEVIAKTQQGFQAAMQSGNPGAMQAAIMQQAAFNLGGSPELQKARKTKAILTEAMKNADKSGDEIADQMAFMAEAQRLAIEAELPEIAIQATEQLSQYSLMQEERNRLKSAEQRAAAAESRKAELHDLNVEGIQTELDRKSKYVLWDPSTGESVRQIDIRNAEELAEATAFVRENPSYKLATSDEVFGVDADMLLLRERMKQQAELDAAKAKAKGTADVIGIRKYNEAGTNQLLMQQYNSQAVKLLEDNPSVFTTGSSVNAWASNLATNGRSIVDVAFDGGRESFEKIVNRKLDENQIDNAQKRALVMNMAYALATSREGGRLTDQDIDRAIVSLGFLDNPDPRAILTVLLDNATQGQAAWEARSKIGDMYEHSPSTYAVVKDSYETNISRLTKLLEQYGGAYDFGEVESPKPAPTATSPGSPVVGVRRVSPSTGTERKRRRVD